MSTKTEEYSESDDAHSVDAFVEEEVILVEKEEEEVVEEEEAVAEEEEEEEPPNKKKTHSKKKQSEEEEDVYDVDDDEEDDELGQESRVVIAHLNKIMRKAKLKSMINRFQPSPSSIPLTKDDNYDPNA